MPIVFGLTPGFQTIFVQMKTDSLCLSLFNENFAKFSQLFWRFSFIWYFYVNLYYFGSIIISSVCYINYDINLMIHFSRNRCIGIFEGCIGQSITEWEQWSFVFSIIPSISLILLLLIFSKKKKFLLSITN